MRHGSDFYYVDGTSAVKAPDRESCNGAPIVVSFPDTTDCTYHADDEQVGWHGFFDDLASSFSSFLKRGRLNKGLHYENFSGRAFNRMTKGQAFGSGALFMALGVIAVFLGV